MTPVGAAAGVAIRDLAIRFGANEVIRDLNLDVTEGEFLVLLGPSGCGKSTLLHSIAGLIDVAEGRIEIAGQDMTDADPSERGIGMVFQSYALYPTMTVERNMSFGLRVAGMPRAEIEARVQRTAQLLQLEPLLQRRPAQLSGGQRQRVAIGRALVREAGVFLFDEPLSNLDAKLRTELRRELKLLHQRLGSTMIYVTHDQVEAMTLATRIVVMRAGRIQQVGTPNEVYERPCNRFVASFLGAPGMNFISGRLSMLSGGTVFDAPGLSVDLQAYAFAARAGSDQPVVLGIRPEHVHIGPAGDREATVQLVEPMGAHQVVWLSHGGLSLAAVVHDAQVLAMGQAVRFHLDHRRLSLFDQASEQRL
ncbi:MAG: ABC transporter ATP-binding protein [Ideonella sp.]|nr:ABC transporter ATP-binding protein [Ideonella sp.]